MNLTAPPIKQEAIARGLEVVQVSTLRRPEVQESLKALSADLFVVVAFGFILPPEVLAIPRMGCLNVHFSLLPKLRGAAPVQWALIHGHNETGVTIMQLDEGMDTGPILDKAVEPICLEDNTQTVESRLAVKGAALLLEVIGKLESADIKPQAQDDSQATYAPKISKDDARIDWSEQAEAIANRVRGLTPRPGAWGLLGSKRLKIWKVSVGPQNSAECPGVIQVAEDGSLLVNTGSCVILLDEVQPEGKARMQAQEFVRGYRPRSGDRFE